MRLYPLVGFLTALAAAACAEADGPDFLLTQTGGKDGGGHVVGAAGYGAAGGGAGGTGWGGDASGAGGQGGTPDDWGGATGGAGEAGSNGGDWGTPGNGGGGADDGWGSGNYDAGSGGSFPGVGPGTNMSCTVCFGTKCAIDLAFNCITSDPLCQCLVACLMVGSNVAPCALDCGANQSAGMLNKATACAKMNCDGCTLP